MKLQYLIIIFVIISIPMIMLLTHYMSLQKTTLDLQTSYNTKFIEATKQAMEAFEVNTVEWSKGYSRYTDSKRRDVLASINTFKTSYANSLNVTGMLKEDILTYIPAIMYNLYDGFYIYTPTNVPVTKTNSDGLQLFKKGDTNEATTETYNTLGTKTKMNDILYVAESGGDTYTYNNQQIHGLTTDIDKAKKEYKHFLKSFIPYLEKREAGIVDYTLDNFIRVYTETEAREGYLIDCNKMKFTDGRITYNGKEIKPEKLSEQVRYIENGEIKGGLYNYVYNINNEKCYLENGGFFKIIDNTRYDLPDSRPGEKNCEYKSVSLYEPENETEKIVKIYIPLNWYEHKDAIALFDEIPTEFDHAYLNYDMNDWLLKIRDHGGACGIGYLYQMQKVNDFSALNYYMEAYEFTKWVEKSKIFKNESNIFENLEDEDSAFNKMKRECIKKVIKENLGLAMASYSRKSKFDYKMPDFTEEDWEQILSNVSMTSFIQGIPIGLKYYNNYIIAVSSNNKEYLNPNKIYYVADDEYYYHTKGCSKIKKDSNIIGYRATDFILNTIEQKSQTDEIKQYYYKHADVDKAVERCYYCLINKIGVKVGEGTTALESEYEKPFCHAIARERYVQRK